MMIVAAHPASPLEGAPRLLAELSGREAACVDVAGLSSFDAMIDELERVRRGRGVERWLFWGMSGGGWLAQRYAHLHPASLSGIVVESACACFRERLRDPTCAISPYFPAWREALEARGLFSARAHDEGARADGAAWARVEGIGEVLCGPDGGALVVSPSPLDDAMRRQMPLLWTFDARPWLERVRVPALVLAGSADPVVPVARVRAVHEAIEGSTFVVAEGGGHVPSAARPGAVVAAIRAFVERLSPER